MSSDALPHVSLQAEAVENRVDRVAIRHESRIVELCPVERRRHGCAPPWPNGVGRRSGLRVCIARDIDKDSARSLLLPHLEGEVLRIGIDEPARNAAGERADL